MQCPTNSSAQLVECLRSKDAKDIIRFRKVVEVTQILSSEWKNGSELDQIHVRNFLG